jgi:hypothetical protein
MAKQKAGKGNEETNYKPRKRLGVSGPGVARKGAAASSKHAAKVRKVGKRNERIKAAQERRLIKPTVYYAVKFGREPGVYTSFERFKLQVTGFPGHVAKKFKSRKLAEAFVGKGDVVAAEVLSASMTDRSALKSSRFLHFVIC